MKTGKELILELPNGVRRNFIINLCNIRGNRIAKIKLEQKHDSLRELIYAGFVWGTSPLGHDYWEKIYISVKHA